MNKKGSQNNNNNNNNNNNKTKKKKMKRKKKTNFRHQNILNWKMILAIEDSCNW